MSRTSDSPMQAHVHHSRPWSASAAAAVFSIAQTALGRSLTLLFNSRPRLTHRVMRAGRRVAVESPASRMLLRDTATPAAITPYPTSPAAASADRCLTESDALDMALNAMESGHAVSPIHSSQTAFALSPISSYPTTSAVSPPEAVEQRPATPHSAKSPTKSTMSGGGQPIGNEARSMPASATERKPLHSNISPTRASPVSHDQGSPPCSN